MRLIPLIFAAAISASAAPAQESEDRGIDLMGEALRLFMQGLMQEMEPALEGMEGFLDNLDAFHPPEVLPNGDIVRTLPVPSHASGPGMLQLFVGAEGSYGIITEATRLQMVY